MLDNNASQNDDLQNETDDKSSSLLFRNIDAKVDLFAIELERQLQKLPDNLRFIREYLYFEFLPSVNNAINDLEAIKETPNYDDNLVNIRPISFRSINNISCFDSLSNHNIKHSKITKVLYG